MNFAFEVKATDLLGRIGTMSVNGRTVETPCLFPVIHPVVQNVSVDELKAMGFGGLMTNSYILYKRRREEAVRLGLHKLLGFDGVLMTDSGGYQVLEYGDVDISYSEIAEFQSRMGSDLAVTLDRPTGYSATKRYARETAAYSTKNALDTLREFGSSVTTWIGPVQGGLFSAILKKSARSLAAGGFRFLALGSPVQVMENYRYSELARMIVATREAIPYSMPLHLFGAGHPHTMAMAVALGCDTFDSASYILFARAGRYMTEKGVSTLKEMKYLPCSCPVCVRSSVDDLLGMDAKERTKRLAVHNLYVLRKEVEACKEAIAEGRLWDLVHERAAAHPRLQDAFAEFAAHPKLLQSGTPAFKDKGLFVRNELDLARPELASAAKKMERSISRASKTALLLTNNRSLPISKLHFQKRGKREAARDIYGLHPSLGPYPVELDFVYPFTQTMTTTSQSEGSNVREAVKKLRKLGYSSVVLANVDGQGRIIVSKPRSRRKRAGASPSRQSASSRSRAPRHP